jgi:hypothetical protein
MYRRPQRDEPNGCIDSLIIMRLIIGIVFVPTVIMVGGVIAIIGAFYALQISPFLGLFVLILGGLAVAGLAVWEKSRVEREGRRMRGED